MGMVEMRMLRWMLGTTKMDRVRNEFVRHRLGVTPIIGKLRENHLRWYGHVLRRRVDALVGKVEPFKVEGRRRKKGRPKECLLKTLCNDMTKQRGREKFM